MISAKIICDAVNEYGNRLTTFQLRYPRFIHAEFMTHRVFSRNASSTRATPTEKLLLEIRNGEYASPIHWGKNQKGMQAVEELDEEEILSAQKIWHWAANAAADAAEDMLRCGAHKQIVNRMLEPFMHINVVVTATEYMNFFGLRLDKAAQPEIQALALCMWKEYQRSIPGKVDRGAWYLPYVDKNVIDEAATHSVYDGNDFWKQLIKVSVARCARVSYRSFETGEISTMAEDLVLYDRLLSAQPLHASPAEHQAAPDKKSYKNGPHDWEWPEQHGNFVGWRQYRKTLDGEAIAPLPVGY